jgi:asparagine synthase (glutamine-hydrolysing)
LQKNSTQKIKTFTIGFSEEKWDEAPHAKKIAAHLGTDHHEYYCTTKEAQDIFPELADIYDEPFGDSSGIPTTLVSRFARKQVTVSLSADGGDEIFAGYSRYDYLHKLNKVFSKSPDFLLNTGRVLSNAAMGVFPGLKRVHKIARLTEILNTYKKNGLSDIYCRLFNYNDISELINGFDSKIGLLDDVGIMNEGNDFMNKTIGYDYRTYMVDDILTKVDRATMSISLEGREPLLDHRIIEFVSQLPSELKYNNGEKKYLLKKIAHKYIPKPLLDRPKAGFTFPMQEWLTTDLKDYVFNYINEEQLSKHNYLNVKKAIRMRDDFLAGKKNMETQIWLILMFQMWWNKWMEK